MRICVRCQTEMVEGCKLRMLGEVEEIHVVDPKAGVFTPGLGRTRVAVCPKCGEVSFYVERPESLLMENQPGSIYD